MIDPDPAKLTEEVLAGRIRIQDIDPKYPGLFVVQDNVALAGQGRIVDRSKDWLGQSDQGHHPLAQDVGARAEEDRRRQAAEELAPAEREAASAGRPAEGPGGSLIGHRLKAGGNGGRLIA